jgi:hypothetical protein
MFSLRTLFIVVSIAGIASAALATQALWLMSGFVALAIAVLFWGVVQGESRFGRGFIIFGWGYLLVAATPFFAGIGGALPTTVLLVAAVPHDRPLEGTVDLLQEAQVEHRSYLDGQMVMAFGDVDKHHVIFTVGHCAFALLFGLCGGLICEFALQRSVSRQLPEAPQRHPPGI